MDLIQYHKDIQTIMVLDNQFGDTGKGKISDCLAAWADIIARGTGGANAGHTVCVGDTKRIFHLLPAGITEDKNGKWNILGQGMAIDLVELNKELDELYAVGGSANNLLISSRANVVTSWHIEADRKRNQSLKNGNIGSTGRGMGPCYADRTARKGILIGDLLDEVSLLKKAHKLSERYPDSAIGVDEVVNELFTYQNLVKHHIADTSRIINEAYTAGKKILVEGAQGAMLDINHGTYPYVTSSGPTLNGTADGVGMSAKKFDRVYGIVKAPYMTRVGSGPFVTELGLGSEEYCAEGLAHDMEFELKKYGVPFSGEGKNINYDHRDPKIISLMNSENEFEQGVGMRLAGEEYGATTRRPRRTGWLDLVQLKKAATINGGDFIFTKTDVLSDVDTIKVCTAYELNGEQVNWVPDSVKELYDAKPIYTELEGFGSLDDVKRFADLPKGAKDLISLTENYTGGKVHMVSTGPKRSQLLIR